MIQDRLICATISLIFGMLTGHPVAGFLGAMLIL